MVISVNYNGDFEMKDKLRIVKFDSKGNVYVDNIDKDENGLWELKDDE